MKTVGLFIAPEDQPDKPERVLAIKWDDGDDGAPLEEAVPALLRMFMREHGIKTRREAEIERLIAASDPR